MQTLKRIILGTIIALSLIPIIGLAVDFGTPPAVKTNPINNFLPGILGSVLDLIWVVFIAFAVGMFIWAGFLFLVAQGNPEDIAKARRAVLWGVVGVAVGIMAFVFPFFIRNTIAPAPGDGEEVFGACDNGAGVCIETTSADCAEIDGGVYRGDGTTCDADDAAGGVFPPGGDGTVVLYGACFEEEACTVVTAVVCDDMEGVYLGDGTECPSPPGEFVPPPEPTGACCAPSAGGSPAFCSIKTRTQCSNYNPNTVFLGAGSTCSPNFCPNR